MRWDDYFLWFVGLGTVAVFTLMSVTGCVTVRHIPSEESQLEAVKNAYEAGCVEGLSEVAMLSDPPIALPTSVIREACGKAAVRYRETLRSKNPR